MKRKLFLVLILVAVAIAFVASRQPDPSVESTTFQARFSRAMQRNGFIPDVRLEPLGPQDTPFSRKDAPASVPVMVKWHPRRWYSNIFGRDGQLDYRVGLRGSSSTAICSVVCLDGLASFVLLRAQPSAIPLADSLRSVLTQEFPGIPIKLQPSRSFRPEDFAPLIPWATTSPKTSLGVQKYLSLTPDLTGMTLNYGYPEIPSVLKNEYTEDIGFRLQEWNRIDLKTLDYSGQMVPPWYWKRDIFITGGGPIPDYIVLKPGESTTVRSHQYSMETLGFLADRDNRILAKITASIVSTNESFEACSDPFPVPPEVARLSWDDLGKNNYFSVVPDTSKVSVTHGRMLFPVKITNTTNQAYIAATDSVIFCRLGREGEYQIPWETVKSVGPILKPGESANSTGRGYIILSSWDYRPGATAVAVVGGRVPNTNKIFECYSEPFELPPLPAGDQLKP